MENNKKFSELASEMAIDRTVSALKKNGFIVYVVNNREEARIQVFDLLPDGGRNYEHVFHDFNGNRS